jgi:hypothetical protein
LKRKLKNLKSKAKKRKIEQKASKASTYHIIVVGAKLKNNNDFYEEVQNKRLNLRQLKSRVLVSGHWRAQWYGSEKERYTETIWIEPYFKGPEMANVINSRYIVK